MWRGGSSEIVRRRWGHPEARARAAWVLAADLAADAMGADMRKVVQHHTGGRGRTVDDRTAQARKLACYLGSVTADVAPERLGQASGLNRATIHKHCRWVEDQRDRPEFDALVQKLEAVLIGMCARVVLANLAELEEGEA